MFNYLEVCHFYSNYTPYLAFNLSAITPDKDEHLSSSHLDYSFLLHNKVYFSLQGHFSQTSSILIGNNDEL